MALAVGDSQLCPQSRPLLLERLVFLVELRFLAAASHGADTFKPDLVELSFHCLQTQFGLDAFARHALRCETNDERIKRRGLVILFSDLLDSPAAVLSGLQHFRHRNHEVIVFHVLDPDEIEFPYTDASTFVDMETGAQLTTEPWEIAARYRQQLEAWRGNYARSCREQRIDYVPLDTRTPFDKALLAYLEKRATLL